MFETCADPIVTGLVASLRQTWWQHHRRDVAEHGRGREATRIAARTGSHPKTFALLVNPSNPKNAEATFDDLQAAARTLGCNLRVLNASTEAEFVPAFAALTELKAGGLVFANETSSQAAASNSPRLRYVIGCLPCTNRGNSCLQAVS